VGLGHSFLRHIQRTRLIIHVLDGAGEDPLGDFVQINTELALFDPHLAHKPQIAALNKMDLPETGQHFERVKAFVEERGLELLAISAATHAGVQDLMNLVAETLAELPKLEEPEEIPVFKLEDSESDIAVVREGGSFLVTGKRIERAASMTYWEYDEALSRFHKILLHSV
jgi:GTP-binding protein